MDLLDEEEKAEEEEAKKAAAAKAKRDELIKHVQYRTISLFL